MEEIRESSSMCSCSSSIIYLFFLISWCCCSCYGDDVQPYNSVSISSYRYSDYKLSRYEWRYIRVELPSSFSSLSLYLQSNVDIDIGKVGRISKSKLPIICFRNGSPPLPDASDNLKDLVLEPISDGSFADMKDLQHLELCSPVQSHIMLRLTNEQISSGIWYIGLFNGIGYERTQSKMINRGSSFTFSANISVDGCTVSGLWGPYCKHAIVPLSCDRTAVYEDSKNISDASSHNQTAENGLTCRNSFEIACSGSSELKIYSLHLTGTVQLLKVMVKDSQFNRTISRNSTKNINGTLYARHGAIPSIEFHDFSVDIAKTPLVVDSPKIGCWYIGILPVNETRIAGAVENNNINSDLCYSLNWEVFQCPEGKAGPNCSSETYILQTIPGKNPSGLIASYYLPVDGKMSPESANFPLEPLLSNSSGDKSDIAWTYFLLDIPREVVGGNIHVQLQADTSLTYEIYSRFGGLPSLDSWDYYYANKSSNSNGSIFFKVYDSSDEGASFYILSAREGRWTFGLRHRVVPVGFSNLQTTMSLTVERCPNKCSDHGKCEPRVDDSGLSFYSYCNCDRNHGGFDCGITIVTHEGHVWQSVALIASNAAAILPAFWALRKRAFAEWVIFTTSGVSSALYHACDVGTWCALSFHVLQFMDFWLSFMAVVSTFIYLTTIEEVTKRAIHTCVAILTALMAATGATRSSNIPLVIAIGASGLFIGLLIEFSTTLKSILCSRRMNLNIIERWLSFKVWLYNLLKTIRNRFRWIFVLVGFALLSMAAVSWKMESTASYWIWHSVWHVTIYTSSFFFLCSKITSVSGDGQVNQDSSYELTRQDSFSR